MSAYRKQQQLLIDQGIRVNREIYLQPVALHTTLANFQRWEVFFLAFLIPALGHARIPMRNATAMICFFETRGLNKV